MRTVLTFAALLLAKAAAAETTQVVVDVPPVHSLVAQVMEGVGEPVLLLDRGGDPHAFQLRPSQARALAGADLMFWIGPELTPSLERARAGTEFPGEAVALLEAEGTRVRSYGEDGHDDHGHDDHGHDDEHGSGADPHAWLDPGNGRVWLSLIAERLAAADPDNAALYVANAEAARARLDVLDAELRALLAPAAGWQIYVFHDAYGYFADAYGLTIAGTLAEGDAADPGAARLAALRDEIAQSGGRACLFAEANHDPGIVESVAEGTGLKVGTLDPAGVEQAPGPEHYAATLRALADEIAACAAGG